MSARDKAMRAAAEGAPVKIDGGIVAALGAATAGADAELARVCEWLRGPRADWYAAGRENDTALAFRLAADAIEARAHWKDDQ